MPIRATKKVERLLYCDVMLPRSQGRLGGSAEKIYYYLFMKNGKNMGGAEIGHKVNE